MNKTVLRVGTAALAALLICDAASAASSSDQRKRKNNIFIQIFGSAPDQPDSQRRKRRTIFGSDWFNDGRKIRIIDGSPSQADGYDSRGRSLDMASDGDPEGDPGFGMGNLTYVPEATVGLGTAKLPPERPAAPEAAAVYDALGPGDGQQRVVPAVRDAVVGYYADRGFQPLWTVGGKLTPRAREVFNVLAKADDEGLDSQRYLPPGLTDFTAPDVVGDEAAAAQFDVGLTVAALNYARDASGGMFEPSRLSLYHDVKPPTVDSAKAIKVIGSSPFVADYLRGLNPVHPAYAAMKAELAKLRAEAAAAKPAFAGIEAGPVVRKGEQDARVAAVRQRLAELGYAEALDASGEADVLDADLSVQVRLFQKASGIAVDGMIGNQTVKALNDDHSQRDVARLLDNMERLRWLPHDLGPRYVFVNQAAFEVRVMNHGQAEWQSRVIVGKPMTQTVVFNDEIETVVFNPSWGVPPSIIANEYLPKLRRDPGYLDRIGFKVVDARGKVVPSGAVDWWSYGNKVPYGIQQPPGGDNALGELKFLFPNSHNIYMHDTPTRNLFEKDVRAYSHGCVRVQNPRDFASVLLGWDAHKIAANVESRRSQSVRLERKVPIYLSYFTAWPDDTGKMQYFNDIYGRDKAMDNARAGLTMAQR